MADGPSLLRSAHGTAAAGGAMLVVETPPLDELRPLNAEATAAGLALQKRRGKPLERGNMAAVGRAPSLAIIGYEKDAPPERRQRNRKAASLQRRRVWELSIQYGGPSPRPEGMSREEYKQALRDWGVSSGVRTELKSWACALADAETFDRAGDPLKAAGLRERASGHQIKAIAIAEREAGARPRARVNYAEHFAAIGRGERRP